MSDALLDYSSWSFQLIFVLAMLYLVFGLAKPSWVLATKRSTVAVVAVVVLLVAGPSSIWPIRPLPMPWRLRLRSAPSRLCHSRPPRSPDRTSGKQKAIDRPACGMPQSGRPRSFRTRLALLGEGGRAMYDTMIENSQLAAIASSAWRCSILSLGSPDPSWAFAVGARRRRAARRPGDGLCRCLVHRRHRLYPLATRWSTFGRGLHQRLFRRAGGAAGTSRALASRVRLP